MINVALKGLELAINKYLYLDPDTLNRLQALHGEVIRIEFNEWSSGINFAIAGQGLHLSSQTETTPCCVIRGPILGLLQACRKQSNNATLMKSGIETFGDTDKAQMFQEILQRIDIDWEEHLSHFVGDGLAHKIYYRTQKIKSGGKNILSRLCHQVKNYLHEESPRFPSSQDLEELYQDISQLRDDVDRLEARIERLSRARKNTGDTR